MAWFPSILQWWPIKFTFAVIAGLILSHTHAFTHIWCTSVHYHPQQWSTCPVFGQLEPLQICTQLPKSLGEDKISQHHVWDWSLVKVKLKIHMEGFYPVKILFAQILENGKLLNLARGLHEQRSDHTPLQRVYTQDEYYTYICFIPPFRHRHFYWSRPKELEVNLEATHSSIFQYLFFAPAT